MKAFLRAHTPEPIWAALRSTKYLAIDSMASLRGRPPKDLIAAIGGEFKKLVTGLFSILSSKAL